MPRAQELPITRIIPPPVPRIPSPVSIPPPGELGPINRAPLAILEHSPLIAHPARVNPQRLDAPRVRIHAEGTVAHPERQVSARQIAQPLRHVHISSFRPVRGMHDRPRPAVRRPRQWWWWWPVPAPATSPAHVLRPVDRAALRKFLHRLLTARPANIHAQRLLVPRRRIESEGAVAHPKACLAANRLPERRRHIAPLAARAVIRAHDFILLCRTEYRRPDDEQQCNRKPRCFSKFLSQPHCSPRRFSGRLRDSRIAGKSAFHHVHGIPPLRANSYGAGRRTRAHPPNGASILTQPHPTRVARETRVARTLLSARTPS